MPSNVFGQPLQGCCFSPMTGFYRDGFCRTGPDDKGLHTVCIVAPAEFLEFSRSQGNALSTPMEEYDFPGLKPGDHWCLCVTRWVEAFNAGKAPAVVLEATHVHALEFISLEDLQAHAAKGCMRVTRRNESTVVETGIRQDRNADPAHRGSIPTA